MARDYAFGIDLGTTKASIAYVDDDGRPVLVSNTEGELTTPSVVYIESASNVVVGKAAQAATQQHPDLTVASVKTALGKPGWSFNAHDKSYRAQEIAAMILRHLTEDARTETGLPVKDVVLSYPGFFGANEIAATRQAGELAGLNVLGVISEATAAAYAYGFHRVQDQTVIVYDLGGGTFDVALLQVSEQELKVLSVNGNDHLGGSQWDEAVAAYVAQQFEAMTGTPAASLQADTTANGALLQAVEAAKVALSRQESVEVPVSFGDATANVTLTRETFDQLTAGLLNQTIELMKETVIRATQLGVPSIDKVLLVGGATYMPQVRAALERETDIPVVSYKPNHAVAEGCAIYAYSLSLNKEFEAWFTRRGMTADTAPDELRQEAWDYVTNQDGQAARSPAAVMERRVRGVSSRSFGLLAFDRDRGRMGVQNLLIKDTSLPATATGSFRTHETGQPNAVLKIFQSQQMFGRGVTYDPELCEPRDPIGEVVLTFPTALPKGSPIEVYFRLDEDGRLEVEGKDLDSGTLVTADFRTETIMDAEEIAALQVDLAPAPTPDDLAVQTARDLDSLAFGLVGRQTETAAQLRTIRDIISGSAESTTWTGSEPIHSFDLDMLTANVNPGWQRFTFVTELVRNTLLFAPIIFTWYAIWKAMEAYHAATTADAALRSQPFLLLWQQGFGGHLNGPSLAEAGRTNAFLVLGLLILTFAAQVGNTIVDKGMQQARARATAILLNATRCLGQLKAQTVEVQPLQYLTAPRPSRNGHATSYYQQPRMDEIVDFEADPA